VSQRDCFIDGIPIQFDLFITKPDVEPRWGLLYAPDDVLVALEVKQVGAFPGTIEKVSRDFGKLSGKCKDIICVYVAIEELERYKLAVTSQDISPHEAFTLATYQGGPQNKSEPVEGAWEALLDLLRRKCCQT
jgi:hypothetical protein